MTRPAPSGKEYIDLAAEAAKPSRIRRDPPAAAPKKTVVPDREIVDRRMVAIGILAIAVALVIIIIAVGSWMGWTPRQYTANI